MMLFVDSETTGFVKPDLPPEHPMQPYLVQLGAIMTDDAGEELSSIDLVVAPVGYKIPEQASNVHGIDTEFANKIGLPLLSVMSAYVWMRARCHTVVAFNSDFDDLVLKAAIVRTGRKPTEPGPEQMTCCMRAAGPVINLPPTAKMLAAGFDKWKPPSLKEAYLYFFKREPDGRAHSALADARACKDIYLHMKKEGLIK